MRPRILLIGAAGQVGRELARVLPELGEVIATVRHSGSLSSAVPLRALDVTDLDAVRRTVRDVRPAVIVNAAAYTAVDQAEADETTAAIINRDAPGVLAEEAAKLDAALVHYSTDYVFDGSGNRPWGEDDPTNPLSAYGRTKLAGEEAIRATGAAHLILRISWIYAPQGKNFVRTMLRLGAERSELRVVADQIGAPTPASCVTNATVQILQQAGHSAGEFLRDSGGIYHLPCAGETSWHGFAMEIFRLACAADWPLCIERVLPIATAEYPTPARRPLNSRLDGSLARERFGISLPDWRVALAAEFPAILDAAAQA